jgi:hypothetical protein
VSIIVVIIVVLAAIALALIVFRTAHGSAAAKIGTVDDLEGFTEPIDLRAFLNLVDPAEEEFLRANLSPQVFRRVQRQRLLAAAEYVRCAARNAALVVRLGEAASAEASMEISGIGQELVTAAIRLRALAFLALCLLYVKTAIPNARLSPLPIPNLYQHLLERVGLLARLTSPAHAGRIVQAL